MLHKILSQQQTLIKQTLSIIPNIARRNINNLRYADDTTKPLDDIFKMYLVMLGLSWASQVELVVKNLSVNAGDLRVVGSIPGSGRSPREGNGNILQYSCLENPMDRGALQASS